MMNEGSRMRNDGGLPTHLRDVLVILRSVDSVMGQLQRLVKGLQDANLSDPAVRRGIHADVRVLAPALDRQREHMRDKITGIETIVKSLNSAS